MLVFIGNGVHNGIFAACQPWPRKFYRREIRVSTIIFLNYYLINILADCLHLKLTQCLFNVGLAAISILVELSLIASM